MKKICKPLRFKDSSFKRIYIKDESKSGYNFQKGEIYQYDVLLSDLKLFVLCSEDHNFQLKGFVINRQGIGNIDIAEYSDTWAIKNFSKVDHYDYVSHFTLEGMAERANKNGKSKI